MKKYFASVVLFFAFVSIFFAQETKLTVSVSSDSILLGNYIEVSFKLENASIKDFNPPVFEGFEIVGGPSHSTSMMIINGKTSQEATYTYYVQPKEMGNYYIDPASVDTGDEILESLPIEILVVANPDGIIENPSQREQEWNFFGSPFETSPTEPLQKPKKKRKIYKL